MPLQSFIRTCICMFCATHGHCIYSTYFPTVIFSTAIRFYFHFVLHPFEHNASASFVHVSFSQKIYTYYHSRCFWNEIYYFVRFDQNIRIVLLRVLSSARFSRVHVAFNGDFVTAPLIIFLTSYSEIARNEAKNFIFFRLFFFDPLWGRSGDIKKRHVKTERNNESIGLTIAKL